MRIGVIATLKTGVERFVHRELQFFASKGMEISLYPTKYAKGLYSPDPDWRVYRWNLIKVLLLQPYFMVQQPLRYLQLLIEALRFRVVPDLFLAWFFASNMNDVDVIYSTFGDHKLFVGYFCKLILNKPLTVTFHAHELYMNPNEKLLVRALAVCDQIVAVTEYNREYLHKTFGVDPKRVDVVRLSVDLEEYKPQEKFVILICAFFNERKGHDVLFKAVKQLNRKDIEVWVVGGAGSEAPVIDVAGLAKEIGIEDQVVIFGKVGGKPLSALFHACDVFCLPSRIDSRGLREGFPTVIIEAMAMGKPVISTRHVEIPRILPELLADENDVDGLAQAIEQAYLSPELRKRLGEQNRRIAEAVFSNANAVRKASLMSGLAHKTMPTSAAGREEVVANA